MAKHTLKILGKGCRSCARTEELVREVVGRSGVDVSVEKVTKTSEMLAYRVLSTPAVVLDEQVVHTGGVPSQAEVERWLLTLRA